jgi:hypothetical protein
MHPAFCILHPITVSHPGMIDTKPFDFLWVALITPHLQ